MDDSLSYPSVRSEPLLQCPHVNLRDPRRQREAICNSGEEGRQVKQRRDAVQFAEPLVQRLHLLGMRRRVVTLLAILLLCRARKVNDAIWYCLPSLEEKGKK